MTRRWGPLFMAPILAGFLLAALWNCSKGDRQVAKAGGGRKESIAVSGAFALYPMMVRWSEEFSKTYPNLHVEVSAGGAGKGMTDALVGLVDIGMVSRDIFPAEREKGAWSVGVARDAVVGIISNKSPAIELLRKHGLAKAKLQGIWIDQTVTNWGELFPAAGSEAIHVYTRSDACGAAAIWALYLGFQQEDLKGVGVFGDPGIVEAVKADPLGLGYGNVNFVYDSQTKRPVDGVAVIPLDLNADGSIAQSEQFYADRDQLTRAIGRGAYPSPPSRMLYLVTKGVPSREIVRVFLQWILTDGQELVEESGYLKPSQASIQESLERLRK